MTAPAAQPAAELDDPRLAEWAGPELLKALQVAVTAMKRQLGGLLEIGCLHSAAGPLRSTLDLDLVDEVADLEDAIEGGELAIRKATTLPQNLSAADQAALIARFSPPQIEELQHG
ncbi:MAG TPA: hypothetical protein VGB57_05540 [Allosphingosinicella sp.]|jgi:hypothetical protein